jgi:hypothetical protein
MHFYGRSFFKGAPPLRGALTAFLVGKRGEAPFLTGVENTIAYTNSSKVFNELLYV